MRKRISLIVLLVGAIITAPLCFFLGVIPKADKMVLIKDNLMPHANKTATNWKQKVEVLDPEGSKVILCEDDKAILDLSHIDKGVILVKIKDPGSSKINLVVQKNVIETGKQLNRVYPYKPHDEYQTVNLIDGEGPYTLTIYDTDNKGKSAKLSYFEFDNTNTCGIEPFTYPNTHVNYSEGSSFIKEELTGLITDACHTAEDVVKSVIGWVHDNVTYNDDLIEGKTEKNETIFCPDNTYLSKEGICGDMAVLSVALLRSLDIPAKLHYGDVVKYPSGEHVYHAWLEAYYDDEWHIYDPTIGVEKVIGKQVPKEQVYLEPVETF